MRTTSLWNDSLAIAIAEAEAHLVELRAIRDDGGLLIDPDGLPLSIITSSRGSQYDYCGDCDSLFVGGERKVIRRYWLLDGEEYEKRPTDPAAKAISECPCGSTEGWVGHYAAFPAKLIDPLIAGGSSEAGCCAECGAPYERILERTGPTPRKQGEAVGWTPNGDKKGLRQQGLHFAGHHGEYSPALATLGFRPSCDCGGDPIPCVALDPFVGSGTFALEAQRQHRRWIAIELSEGYCAITRKRVQRMDAGLEYGADYHEAAASREQEAGQMAMGLETTHRRAHPE